MVDLDALRNRFKKEKEVKSTFSSKQSYSSTKGVSDNISEDAQYHYHLGDCYFDGLEGFEIDENKAMSEYLAAAKLGHPAAMIEVSSDYSDSEESILGYNIEEAEKWAKKAIEHGDPDGFNSLYDVYLEKGRGEEAYNQLEIGATKGSLDCIEWLSFTLYYGDIIGEFEVESDEDRAYQLLTSIEWDDEHSLALEILGKIYRDRGDISNAITSLEKALTIDCENYSAMSCLGYLLRNEEVRDYVRAKELLTKAAEAGNLSAMNGLGVMLYLGEGGTKKDESKAIDWLRQSAKGGHLQAMLNLYYCLQDKKLDEAQYWLNRAANEGSEDAKRLLQERNQEVQAEDLSRSGKIYDYQFENISNTLSLSPWIFEVRISGVQKVIDGKELSDYENDRLRLLMGFLSLIYFKKHFCDDKFDEYEEEYYRILDKVDDYVASMTSASDEADYLYNVANMYSAGRFKDVDPLDKLEQLWQNIQNIDLDENETEFKVSFWEETAEDIYGLMSRLLSLDSSNNDDDDDDIMQRVIDIIADKLNVNGDEVRSYTRLVEDLGADSLDSVELIMEMEKEFGIAIPDEEAERIRTVGDIIYYIQSHI